jgi:hypothetical protein
MLSNIKLFHPRRILLLLVIGIVGLITGRFFGSQAAPLSAPDQSVTSTTSKHDSAAFLMSAPDTMDKLVEKADIIVIATIGKKVAEPSFVAYNEQGKPMTAEEMNVPKNWESRFHDFEVLVEQTIKDDGTLAAQKPLILRTRFARESTKLDPEDYYPGVFSGDRYLMFLSHDPDRKTYGFYYAAGSRLLIDGPTITQSDGPRSPLPFAKDMTLNEFLGQVQQLLKQ